MRRTPHVETRHPLSVARCLNCNRDLYLLVSECLEFGVVAAVVVVAAAATTVPPALDAFFEKVVERLL